MYLYIHPLMTYHIVIIRYSDAIQVLSYIYDSNPTSRAALSLLAYCYFYTQVIVIILDGGYTNIQR